MLLIIAFFIAYMLFAWRDHGHDDWHCMDDDLHEIRNVRRWRQ